LVRSKDIAQRMESASAKEPDPKSFFDAGVRNVLMLKGISLASLILALVSMAM
jgi:hypothetical protein